MQAHALTPRLVSTLEKSGSQSQEPEFPFLSVLASGGHTLLLQSTSLVDHQVLGSTGDIAVGDCLDKIARVVLPADLLQTTRSTMYGALLENFAWSRDDASTPESDRKGCTESGNGPTTGLSAADYLQISKDSYISYKVPMNHEEGARNSMTSWGWALPQPLTKAGGGVKIGAIAFSFSGLLTAVERNFLYGRDPGTRRLNKAQRHAHDVTLAERRDLARESMRTAFEHIAHRVILAVQSISNSSASPKAVVVSGGVAANSFLRHMYAAQQLPSITATDTV